jgi:type I restriction enzyme S subunit
VDNLTFDGRLDFFASSYKVSVATHMETLSRSRCLPDDVLTNIVGPPLGKVGLVTEETGELNINQAIAVFRPKEVLSPEFLLSWLTTETVKRWFLQRAKQTSGQLNLTLGMCQAMPVPLMTPAEQQLILDRSQSSERLIEAEQSRRHQLIAQKLGLMQDLLTGRVPVPVHEPEPVNA